MAVFVFELKVSSSLISVPFVFARKGVVKAFEFIRENLDVAKAVIIGEIERFVEDIAAGAEEDMELVIFLIGKKRGEKKKSRQENFLHTATNFLGLKASFSASKSVPSFAEMTNKLEGS